MTREDDDKTPDEEAALAETKIVEEDPSFAETRIAEEDPSLAATKLAEEDPSLAATVVAPVTAVGDSGDASDPAAGAEDDRTQLVERDPGSAAPATGAAAKPTRVLPPTSPGAQGSTPAATDGTRKLPDTRVLDTEQDKTSPPPVRAIGGAAPAATPIDPDKGLAPGTILFGEYEIVNVLGVGGMGEVYRARHRRLDEHRAIKVMHAELSKKKGASEFFYREAKALLAVRHPAVVHCHDLLSDDEGRVYLIMEMIEGIPLSKKMNDGPLSPDDVAILGARVSHGLAAAHRKGVIHRDVSPDNIVLPNGRVQEAKIIDFGIAKLLDAGEGTIVDGFKGKLSYASPEQLGFHGGKIDGRSDFYCLGLVLVAAAMGRPMPMGTSVVEAVDARRNFKKLPAAIPVGLRSAIQPLLALDPDDRPKYVDRLFVVPDGHEDAADSGRISTGGRAAAPTQSGGNRVAMMAGVGAVAMLLVGVGLFLAFGRGESEATTQAVPAAALVAPEAPPTRPQEAAREPVVAQPEGAGARPEAVEEKPVAQVPKKPTVRKPSGRERFQIIGLIKNAQKALDENRLMSPANDNAYDRFKTVLDLDPTDARAKQGLREIATRYSGMADRAIDSGDLDGARDFVERARRADDSAPAIERVEARLGS